MKKKIRYFIKSIAYLVSFFMNTNLINMARLFKNYVYIFSEKRKFNKCGDNIFLEYSSVIRGEEYIKIGDNFSAGARLKMEAYDCHRNLKFNPEIVIGNNVRIGDDCHIGCVNKIVIGNNCLIASKVFITDHFHGKICKEELNIPPNDREVTSKGEVIIGENVWIGEGVAIMPNVKIGNNVVIGANSVVTRDIEENLVVGGIPAKVIKKL